MTSVAFLPAARTVEAPPGSALLEAARAAGVEIDTPCGGEGSCGRCLVRIASGVCRSDSLGILPRSAVDEGYVLACGTVVLDSPLTVEVSSPAGRSGGKFIEDEGEPCETPVAPSDPLARKIALTVPAPMQEDGLSDLDRLNRSLERIGVRMPVIHPLPLVRTLARVLRDQEGSVTVTLMGPPGGESVVDLEPGECAAALVGAAIDVGTTTIAVRLHNLSTGGILATRVDYNAQIACGLDVISRIQYARTPARREELRVRVLGTINSLIRRAAGSCGVRPESISGAVVAGNTTMMHLLLGVSPEHIRLEPYTPTLYAASGWTAGEVGIHVNPHSLVFLCPGVGSYVGGDITAGLLCTGFLEDSDEVRLFMDIGTNGELVVGNREFLLTCACSAGPAFEGGGIEQGMRAAAGAIDRVDIDPESGVARCRTIGGAAPAGICGSGMISLLAGLRRTGWMDQAGKLSRSRPSSAVRIDGRRGRYVVVPAGESGTGGEVVVSETDIENIVRAKAAVYSAVGLLLDHAGMTIDRVGHIYIAGGFGRFLDLEDAVTIGLIPDLPRSNFTYVGNSSLGGASKVLLSSASRKRMAELSRRMTYIELNTAPGYMEWYTSALFLPHTDMRLFPSVEAEQSRLRQAAPGAEP